MIKIGNNRKILILTIVSILIVFLSLYIINKSSPTIKAQNGSDSNSIYLLALENFEKQNYSKSIELFLKYLTTNPPIANRSSSMYYMAIAYFFLSNFSSSEKSFLDAMSGVISDQQRSISLYFLGRIKYLQKNYNYAISYFKNFLDSSGNQSLIINAYFFLWQSYLNKKDNVYAEKYRNLFEKEVAKGEILYFSKEKTDGKTEIDLQKYAEIYEMLYINQTLINQYKDIIIELTKKLESTNLLPPINESEEKYRELYEKGQSEYKNLENKYTELQNAYNELQKQYLSFQAEYENLKQKLSEGSKLEQEYAKLFSDYNELLKKYNDLNEKVNSGAPTISNDEIEKLKKENEELKSAIAEKENTINSLNEQVNSLESKIEEILSGAENSIVQAYETKFLELRKKEADLNNLAQKLQEKEKSLTDLENKLNEKENQLNLIEKKLNRYSMVLDLKIRLLSSLVDFILKKFELFLKITSNLNQ